ncbi:MAG: hypothetical protein L0271_20805 [Gemmatimonadetes bacterium]|nr:hypothetical protein [Gemmatimonadota bacterium]
MSATAPSLFEELKRRRVVRAVLAYTAAVFALLQGAQLVFDGLLVPDFAFRVLVILSLAGFPVVVALAWIYELTADGIRRTASAPGDSPPQRVPLRRWLQVAGIFVMVAVVAAFTAVGLGRLRFPATAPDGRIGLAIFPFRVAGEADATWSEGAADLLATALDGTAGLRVVDPWTLWRPLRPRRDARAATPEPDEAARITAEVDAHRFLIASVVPSPGRVVVNIRLYQMGRTDPIATFGVSGDDTAMTEVVRETAIFVLARVWGASRPVNVPSELDFDATDSPDALKAYLAAKEAMRRGQLDSANVAIDRSIQLDSAFVLALVDAVIIKSWGSFARGQPYAGFFELLDRAEAFTDSLNARTRLRLESVRASVETDGARAASAARRILELDPHDVAALTALGYYQMAYGWQYNAPTLEGRDLAERLVQRDSGSLPALAFRTWWAVALGDTADQRAQLERFLRTDTTVDVVRARLTALRASLADDSSFAAMIPALAAIPAADRITVQRIIRTNAPQRAAAFLRALRATGDPLAIALADGELARLAIARGELAPLDSAISAGAYRANDLFRRLQAHIVAASLVGIGEDVVTRRAVDALADHVTPDSALAHLDSRPVWWFGWLVGAWHATRGDTAQARRWIDALGTLPPGGSPREYHHALQADLRARLAARAGDFGPAMDEARTAYALWSIHTENQSEAFPEPAMRFHLAMLHLRHERPDTAYALLSSLTPPTTWMGFLTARASLEMGDIALARGDTGTAAFHYTRALRLWEGAGRGAAEWLERTRQRLAGLAPG